MVTPKFLFNCQAQEKILNLKYYSVEQGMSDNQVTAIVKDQRGFLWIGTRDGLNRFDGREFHVFRHRNGDSLSLGANSITSLATDNDTMLWIGTATNGLSCYDFRTGNFRSFNKGNAAFPSNAINVVTFDKFRNQLWIGFNNGGSGYIQLPGQRFHCTDSQYPCYSLLPTKKDVYCAYVARSVNKVLEPLPVDSVIKKKIHTVNTIYISRDSTVWVGAWNNAVHKLDLALNYKESYLLNGNNKLTDSGDEIYAIREDQSGNLWLGTKLSGVQIFNPTEKKFQTQLKFSTPINSRVYSLFTDEHHRMWIGTSVGLYLYDPAQNQFQVTLLPIPENASSCHVHGKCTTPGGTDFLATGCGLFYRKHNESSFTFVPDFYEGEQLQLTSIFQTEQNEIYVGSNKTIFELDTATLKLKIMEEVLNGGSFNFNSVFASTFNNITSWKNKENTLLITSIYGHFLALVDPTNNKVRLLTNVKPRQKGGYLENLVRKIYVDGNNRIFTCGVTRGLQQILLGDPDTASASSLPELKGWINYTSVDTGIQFTNIYDIVPADDKSFWVTSQGSGLLKFNPSEPSNLFTVIPGNYQSLQGIRVDNENKLWIISSSGIINYDPRTSLYKRFDQSHGIPVGVSGYFLEQKTGVFSAGFNGGFIVFNPDSIIPNTEIPKTHITRLWIMDQAADSLIQHDLIVPFNKNFLRFYLSANSFSFNDQTTFHYQLEGIDIDWRNNGNNPLITYTNLPAGTYTLRYKAINSDGVEGPVMSYNIEIVPPFYRTWWFYGLATVAILAMIFLFYRYRINQLMKLQEVRNKIARDLHDDIGSTLGSIHLYSQVAHAKMHKNGNVEVADILKKIESGSQEIIGKTSDAIWVAKSDNDQVKDLIWKMENYCASLLGTAGIAFNITYSQKIESVRLNMDSRKNLFLIFKECIHNIIKYAGAKEVTIDLIKKNHFLILRIADDGEGIKAEKMRAGGNGLQNMKHRAEESGGHFEISSTPQKGTIVEVRFPA